jgi:hypothetical protein
VKGLDPRLRLLTLVALVGAAFLVVALSGSLSADGVRDRIDSLGAAGPLLFIPIQHHREKGVCGDRGACRPPQARASSDAIRVRFVTALTVRPGGGLS